MLEQLFFRSDALTRQLSAPLVGERRQYLLQCASQGMARRTLLAKARLLLSITEYLRLAERPYGRIALPEIEKAADRWSTQNWSSSKSSHARFSRNDFITEALGWLRLLNRLQTIPKPVSVADATLNTGTTSSAFTAVSVDPINNTTFSFDGKGVSCYLATIPTAPPPPPPPPVCIFNCGGFGPEVVSGVVATQQLDPAFTPGIPIQFQNNCLQTPMPTVSITVGIPQIESINQPSANIGTSGSFIVKGSNLADSTGLSIPSFGNTSISSIVNTPYPNTESVSFTIPNTQPMGNYQFTISNLWGTSNAVNFAVGAPPAVITGLDPPAWQAGTTFPLTIHGSGFGNAPGGLSISGIDVIPNPSYTVQPDGTRIDTTVTVLAGSPVANAAEVTVQPVYAGNNFTCGTCNGGSPVGMSTAPINPVTPPVPTIILGTDSSQCGSATNQANTTQTVSIGQKVSFIACIPTLPSGLSIAKESWSPTMPDASNALAGFSVTENENKYVRSVTQVSGTTCGFLQTCTYNSFYWTAPVQSVAFTFKYTASNGTPEQSATITFTAVGPSGVTVTPTAASSPKGPYFFSDVAGDAMGLGDAINTVGMKFSRTSPSDGSPVGNFFWVQVINSRDYRFIPNPGIQSKESPLLDNSYPYSTGSTVDDSPAVDLISTDGEIEDHFIATMYLMWKPQAASNCNGNDCTIEVPLGSSQWGYINDAIYTQNPDINSPPTSLHGWVSAPAKCLNNTAKDFSFQGGTNGYPDWNDTVLN
jgi:hypothetical protein